MRGLQSLRSLRRLLESEAFVVTERAISGSLAGTSTKHVCSGVAGSDAPMQLLASRLYGSLSSRSTPWAGGPGARAVCRELQKASPAMWR
jgi:hypothetical protein